MANQTASDDLVQHELVALVLRNAVQSAPLQFVAIGYVVYLGLSGGNVVAATAMGVLATFVGIWRLVIAYRYKPQFIPDFIAMKRAVREIEINSLLSGIAFGISTFGIYPHTHGVAASAYIIITVGSVAIAAFFMSLAGRSFLFQATPNLGAVILVSLLNGDVRSTPMAVLISFFGVTMIRVARTVRDTTARAISQSMDLAGAVDELRKAKETAEAANLAKSQFLATMSHEIRTPMNGMLGSLEVLRLSQLNPDQRRLVRIAATSGESLLAILNDLLDHSKIEAGQFSLATAPISLHNISTSVASLFRSNAEAKGLTLTLEIQPGALDRAWGDALRLKQVLLNLVGNAIKFTDRGDVTLRLLRPQADKPHLVRFEVSDTGVGMSQGETQDLFQPFHQIVSNQNTRRGGTGLGLSISQRIIEAMRSRIAVLSQKGVGSTFYFDLELQEDTTSDEDVPVDSTVGNLDEPPPCPGQVLVVEDNAVNRMLASAMLTSLGASVLEAEHGAEAIDIVNHQNVDLVFMDFDMPVMDGFLATEAIRAREADLGLPRVPIIALTANAFEEDVARCLAAGMDAHLAKPFSRTQLQKVLSQWL